MVLGGNNGLININVNLLFPPGVNNIAIAFVFIPDIRPSGSFNMAFHFAV